MQLHKLTHIYFLGIGGIGMSALARFFNASGKQVCGYDKYESELTSTLIAEGINIHFEENVDLIPVQIKKAIAKESVLIVWTPAVPLEHIEFVWFQSNGFNIMKRAQVLGLIVDQSKTIAVAGTHGKSTTTTMIAHILRTAAVDCSAFLGGIAKNYNTNLLLGKNLGKENVAIDQNIVVAEADEYDRSLLWLHPFIAVITSVDPDHLDVYGDETAMHKTYQDFVKQVEGYLITKSQVIEKLNLKKEDRVFSYSLDDTQTDSYAENIKIIDGFFTFNLVVNNSKISDLRLGLPGRHNLENAIAAVVVAKQMGVNDDLIRKALSSFSGVERRFDFRIRSQKIVFVDDYAHHPVELTACISSLKEIFPGKKVTGIFQPHLYSRTRDFAQEFAKSLELLDEVILLDIYPAREMPIPGITSAMLLEKIQSNKKYLYSKVELIEKIVQHDFDILVTMGAGDIANLCDPLERELRKKHQLTEELI